MSRAPVIPDEAIAHHTILLGKTRAGKSSTMRGIVERLLDQNKPVGIIDPKGDWWGLKSSADGKRAGYPVIIFGGEHADVPINAMSGKAVAELVATGNRPFIIDLGGWMVGERTRFFIDFASTFFRYTRGPRHLAIDEVHNFAPQGKVHDVDAGKMLHWANRLASEGAGKGITLISASQRPQKVHKDYVTSHETLIAMRVIHILDRNAVKDWLDGAPDKTLGRQVLDELASLDRGEAWVWSPEAKFGPARVRFPMFKTYDSFAAPTSEQTAKLKGWASVDLEDVKTKLEAAVEEAKANDPIVLKAEIANLKRDLAKIPTARVEWPDQREEVAQLRGALEVEKSRASALENRLKEIAKVVGAPLSAIPSFSVEMAPVRHVPIPLEQRRRAAAQSTARREPVERSNADGLRRSHQKVLDSLAWWAAAGFPVVERRRACIMAGYSPKASTFGVYISELTRDGLVEVPEPGKLALTPAGKGLANAPDMTSPAAILDAAREQLSQAEIRLFDEIVKEYPQWVARPDLADRVGLSRTASTLGVYLSKIASFDFIETGRGTVRASDWLFT